MILTVRELQYLHSGRKGCQMRKLVFILALSVVWMFTVASSPVVTGAKVRINAKKYEETIQLLEDNKAAYPDDPELFYYLGRAYAGTANWENAGENFAKALTLNPSRNLKREIEKYRDFYWTQFIKEGSALLQQKRYDVAIEKYVIGNKINPDRKESWANLGVSQLEHGRILEEADTPNPEAAKALYADAAESFKKAIELDPGNEAYVMNLAQTYLMAGREEDAIDLYEEILEADPDDYQVKSRLVTLYMTRQEFVNAARIYDSMLEDAGAELTADDHFNAASCYYQIYLENSKKEDQASKDLAEQSLQKAANAYEMVLKETPNDCEAATQLYYTYINMDKWDSVVATIETMFKTGCPREYVVLQNLGVAYVKVGNTEKAAATFKEAEALKPAEGTSSN